MKEGGTLTNNYKLKSNFINFKKISSDHYKDFPDYFSTHIAETAALTALAFYYKTMGSIEKAISYILEFVNDETTAEFIEKFVETVPKENIISYAEKLDEETLKNSITTIDSDFERVSTPDGLSEIVMHLLDLKKEDLLLDLGSGVGSFLSYVSERVDLRGKYGIELDTSNYIVSVLRRLLFNTNIEYIIGNMIIQDFTHLNSNKIFSNPPLGTRWRNINEYSSVIIPKKYHITSNFNMTGDWAFALAALSQLALPGRCIVIMSNSATWNKSDESIRRMLVEEGKVEGIIALPENLFSKLSVTLSLVVFSTNNLEVRMVDATKIFTKGRKVNTLEISDIEKIWDAYKNESEISRSVSIDEISSKEYMLNPLRYIESSSEIENYQLLGNLVKSVNRGAMISSAELDALSTIENSDSHYLMLQNIQDGIVSDELPKLRYIDEKYEKFCIEDGDLIISKISPFKIARAKTPEGKKVLANGNLYFIKVDESKVNPVYLEFILQSELGISQLSRLAKGSTIKNISIQDLKEVKIPVLSMEKQKQIADKYESICDDLKFIEIQSQRLKEKREKLIEEVI
jgi:type I restriction enzyme M protein